MILRVLVAAWAALCPSPASADEPRASRTNELLVAGIEEFASAYNAWDSDRFVKAAALFEKAGTQDPRSCDAFYWQGVAEFHRLLNLLGQKQTKTTRKEAGEAMQSAIDSLEKALRLNARHAESHILLSTVYGMSIGEHSARAIWLGPRVMDHKKLAIKYDPDNPRVWYLIGMSQFHGPGMLGGKNEALQNLLKAEKLFEKQADKPRTDLDPNWGRSNCLAFIGKTYDALDKPSEAEKYFRKSLEVNPQDKLAHEELEKRKK